MKKIFWAVMLLVALASSASADVRDAIVRVAITGTDVNLRVAPNPEADVVSKASAPAEYIAARYKSVYAGTTGDGSEWYELIGIRGWDEASESYVVAPSIEGRSAAGAELDGGSLYVSAKFVREIPLRDGDADAVREMLARPLHPDAEEPKEPIDKFLSALDAYVGRRLLEAAAMHGTSSVRKWWDTDDEDISPAAEVRTDEMSATYIEDWLLQVQLAKSGADIGGVVLGRSTVAEVRAILGDDGSEGEVDEDKASGFAFAKTDLSGGAPTYDPDGPKEQTIPFKAVSGLHWSVGEEMGKSISIYFDEAGHAVAIEQFSFGWR